MAGEWVHQSIGGGWRTLGRDPVGILLPAAGVLLLHVGAALIARAAWGDVDLGSFALALLAVHAARVLLTSPLRAPLIAAGARALDRPATGSTRALQLLVVDLVTGALQLAVAALIAVPVGALSFLLLERGLHLFGAIGVGIALVGAAAASLLVRAALAYAPAEVVVARRGPLSALAEGWRGGRGDRVQLAIVLLFGDLAVAGGGALCGAGALPGYPLADLAILHRWTKRTKEVG